MKELFKVLLPPASVFLANTYSHYFNSCKGKMLLFCKCVVEMLLRNLKNLDLLKTCGFCIMGNLLFIDVMIAFNWLESSRCGNWKITHTSMLVKGLF